MSSIIIALTLLLSPALAHDRDGDGGWWRSEHPGHHRDGGYHGAPGPIAGAGLPVLAVGYGVYWLVRRRKRNNAAL